MSDKTIDPNDPQNVLLTELHNRIAKETTVNLVAPILAAGGSGGDVLVLLESVTAGVFATMVKHEYFEQTLKAFTENVEGRLVELRAAMELAKTETAGHA